MLVGLATAALTGIIMVIVAITGESDAGTALALLVFGGVTLLIVGLALIALAVWPDPYEQARYEYERVSWAEWFEDLLGIATPVGPSQRSRYDDDPGAWSIPGWEPPEGMESPVHAAREEPPPPPAPAPELEWRPPRRATERRPPRPQLSKYD